MTDSLWEGMAKATSCGYCGAVTAVDIAGTCEDCGRMLCPICSDGVGKCSVHAQDPHEPACRCRACKLKREVSQNG